MPRPCVHCPLVLLLALSLAGAARPVGAQGLVLRVHPHVGDTLHTRLDQVMDVSGGTAGTAGDGRSMTTSIALRSRTIVRESTPASTVVLTIVDSVDVQSSDVHADAQVAEAERTLRGQQLLLQLAPDGTVESARDMRGGGVGRDLARSMSGMPAVFPKHPVRVGEQWMREMPLPAGGPLGARGSGHVIAAFRLDSVARDGGLAYVSMQGDIRPDPTSDGVELTGTVEGSMQIDRLRGWLTDSRFTVVMRSLVTPPASTGLAPMRFVTRVTQRLRTMDKR
jgi:hypothetical protein